MLGAVAVGDEAVEQGPPQEQAERPQAAGPDLAEGEVGGEDLPAQEALALWAAEEGDDLGLDAVGVGLAEPAAEGGGRDVVLGGVLAQGGGQHHWLTSLIPRSLL